MRFHFSIKASFRVYTKVWYCVTKGNISFPSLLGFVSGARTSVSVSFIYLWLQFVFQIVLVASVHHQPSSVFLNFETLSSNSFDKSVGDKPQNVCWKVSVVFTSRITFSFNLVPLYKKHCLLCLKTLSQWISVVNLIVGWCKFASSKKVTMSGLKTV